MARFRDIVTSLLAGEISPRALGRYDLELQKQACEEMLNTITFPQGGAARRPGTEYVTKDSYSSGGTTYPPISGCTDARVIPFVISKTESYLIIFTTNTSGGTSSANKGIHIWDVVAGAFLEVNFSTNGGTFSTAPGPNSFYQFTTAEQLAEIKYAKFGNAIFFAQKDRPPIAISKDVSTGGVSGLYVTNLYDFGSVGLGVNRLLSSATVKAAQIKTIPFAPRNTSTATVTAGATSGTSVTLTFSSAVAAPTKADLYTYIRITNAGGTVTGVGYIHEITDSTHCKVETAKDFGDTSATSNFAFSAWNNGGANNGGSAGARDKFWPRSVAVFENRLYFGGCPGFPNKIWASRIGYFGDIQIEKYVDDSPYPGVTAEAAFEFTLAADELNEIQWMSPKKSLIIGTLGTEYIAAGTDPALSLSALNFGFSPETSYGSKSIQPARVGSSLIFAERSGRKLREFTFNFQEDAYKGLDIMQFAEHMPRKTQSYLTNFSAGQIQEIHYQGADNNMCWMLDNNGGFFSMSRDRDNNTTGFHYHKMGGALGSLPAKVLSMCVCPSADGTHDDVYFLVRKTINNASVTHLEKMGRYFEHEDVFNASTSIRDKMVFVDDAKLVILGSPGVTFTGFSHLEGASVQVIADGKYVGYKTVTSGNIVLDESATEIIAGFNYRSLIKPTALNVGSVIGSSQQAPKSIDTVTVRFVRTIGCQYGPDIDTLYDFEFYDPTVDQSEPIPLFSGDKEISFPEGWYSKAHIFLVQDLPFPMEIINIVARGLLND